mgnify:CR=1 FL=1
MNNLNERLRELIDFSRMSNPKLEETTGIKRESWSAMRNKRTRANEEHIESISKIYPEFAYWLVTGETIESAGQISPDIEESRRNLKTGTH